MRIIGVDTGGTFTDLIYKDGDQWKVHKLLSTPSNPAEAVLAGLAAVAPEAGRMVVHGSTVATNAILERKGVRTALVTNDRFTDVIVIGRQNRSRLYDLAYSHESPIVPQELRFGAPGRVNSAGDELEPLTEDDAERVADLVRQSGAESVAVCLLFSFARPEHERRLGNALAELGIPVSLSHEIVSEFREFERMSTTVVNAYVSPKMHRYLSFLEDRLFKDDSLRIMQSNGGSISAATAMHESVRTILSGPAGGVVGALEIGTLAGHPKLITFDMGGTSSDVALMDGALSLTMESAISGYPVKTPMIDIHTVGAGGGSIAAVDAGGSLTVGPESAGADPGPICYGKGSGITVTDANLFLGRLIPEHFLGGNMALDLDALEKPFADMAAKLGLTSVELAEGILAVANANMERAIRVISVERGFDPREFTLFSFGGAGGLHAAALAKLLNMEKVFIPKNPGILSAVGMLLADIVKDYSHTVMVEASDSTSASIGEALAPLEARGVEDLAAEGIGPERMAFERYLDMRYEGQSYEILTPFDPDAKDMDTVVEVFHELHERTYGYRNQTKPVQVVNVRLRARGMPTKPTFAKSEQAGETPQEAADLGAREVIFDGEPKPTRVYRREELKTGNVIPGPAVLVEYTSTLLVPPYATAVVDEYENLILTIS